MKATKRRIERLADAIKFLVPLNGCSAWTEKGLAVTKWPKGFSKDERAVIRRIAKTAIEKL